jgi:hypothetical protein
LIRDYLEKQLIKLISSLKFNLTWKGFIKSYNLNNLSQNFDLQKENGFLLEISIVMIIMSL